MEGLFCLSEYFWIRKNFFAYEGITDFCGMFFCLTLSKNSVRGTLCFRIILVPNIFFILESITIFSKFCFTVPINFVSEPFWVSKNFWYRKVLRIGRGYHDFSSRFFCLKSPKHLVEELYCVSKKFWYRKMIWTKGRGVSRTSAEDFCITLPKISVGEPFQVS